MSILEKLNAVAEDVATAETVAEPVEADVEEVVEDTKAPEEPEDTEATKESEDTEKPDGDEEVEEPTVPAPVRRLTYAGAKEEPAQPTWTERMVGRPYKERSRDFAEFALRWLTTKAVCAHFGSVDTMHKRIYQGRADEDRLLASIKQLYEADAAARVASIERTFVDALAGVLEREDAYRLLLDMETRATPPDRVPKALREFVEEPWQVASDAFREMWMNMPGGEHYDA